jgi:hypothetical protein
MIVGATDATNAVGVGCSIHGDGDSYSNGHHVHIDQVSQCLAPLVSVTRKTAGAR